MTSLSDGNFGQFSTVDFLERFIGSRLGTPPHFGAEKGAGGILGCVAKSFWEVPKHKMGIPYCCWWFRNPVNSPVDMVVYSIIYRVVYIPGGCWGFLPSTVSNIISILPRFLGKAVWIFVLLRESNICSSCYLLPFPGSMPSMLQIYGPNQAWWEASEIGSSPQKVEKCISSAVTLA